jgi:hypothetical protein
MRLLWVIAVAVGALVAAGTASSARLATTAELHAMMRAGFETGPGSFVEWALVSTRDPHYAIFYAKRCGRPAFCGSHIRPTYGYLLRRAKIRPRSHWGVLASAKLHPAWQPSIVSLCRATPMRLRRELLGKSLCHR